jgi:hypothetical protein
MATDLFEPVSMLCVVVGFVGAARGSGLMMFGGIIGIFASIFLHGILIQ